MTCDSAQPFLEAYVDRELDAINSLSIEDHLKTCELCSRRRAQLEALHNVIATKGLRYRTPDGLRDRILADLRAPARRETPRKKQLFNWRWAAIAASILVSALAAWQILSHSRQGQQDLIAKEIVSSHVRSLLANHLVDEPSSDQHAVKPWFTGRLDFSPTVKNLDAEGFMLAGGRLDYLDNRTVAAIVYRRRQHVINLFVWPSSQETSGQFRSTSVNGFNTVSWRSDGLLYWAISDLNKQELELFSQLSAR